MHRPHYLLTPSSSPIMKDFWRAPLALSIWSHGPPHPCRSRCSPGSTTWRTRSCWTWSPCWRASVRRRTFTASCRVWGTGSRIWIRLRLCPRLRLRLSVLQDPRYRPPAGLCVQTRDPDASSQHMSRCGDNKLCVLASQLSVCTGLLKMNITVCTYSMFLRARPT